MNQMAYGVLSIMFGYALSKGIRAGIKLERITYYREILRMCKEKEIIVVDKNNCIVNEKLLKEYIGLQETNL